MFFNNKAEETIHKFRMQMLIRMPFYGDILLRLPILRDDSIPTACTDGRSIRWNGRFFTGLSEAEIRYVLMHEVFHILLKHPLRLKGKDPQIWNVAADIIVNAYCDQLARSLINSEINLFAPENIIRMHYSFNDTAENLYQKILTDNPNRRRGFGKGNDRPVVVIKGLYKGTDKSVIPREDLYPGSMSDTPLTPEEEKNLEQMIDKLIREASIHDRGVSRSFFVPRELLTITNAKPLNWRSLLKEFLSEAQSDDTSYATPERKYLHMDMILPGHGLSEEGELESVWAFVDSSGSVGQADLKAFLTQLYHIVKDFQCEMNIAYWDTEVTDVYEKIRRKDQVVTAQPHHSGGTDINCVYKYVCDRKLRPLVSIILTDGYFGVPDPVLSKALPSRETILLLCNDSENPVYKNVGRVCRLQQS